MDGWYGRHLQRCGLRHGQADREVHQEGAGDLLYKEPTKIKVEGINLTYEGVIPKIQKSMLSKDVDAMQPHVRALRGAGHHVPALPGVRGHAADPGGAVVPHPGKNIADLCEMQISDLAAWVRELEDASVAPLLNGLQHLLDSFAEIGLGYLSLDRPAGTLSGGEAQRTKMIRHLGSSLTDVTYVFDEPTIGLHPHDIERMNELLLQLRDKGNTVLVVEHKPETIAIADHVVDLGPGRGHRRRRGLLRGHRGGAAAQRHQSPAGTSTTGRPSRSRCARRPARWRCAARRRTTCRTSTSTSRSACCACSPAWRARARARW